MNPIPKFFSLLLFLWFNISTSWTQAHNVFLLGNFSDIPSEQNFINDLNQLLADENGQFTLLLTGDITNEKMTSPEGIKQVHRLKKLMDYLQSYPQGSLQILPGDRDWNKSGKGGQYAEAYYELLAKEIDLVGTIDKEYFEAQRQSDGSVQVRIYQSKNGNKGKLRFERTFLKEETKEIRLFGLGGDDVFDLKGAPWSAFLIYILVNF